ncbi:Uncharacterised protein [Mycoplasmopsis maculosa]|uniref:Uncharacterized protein n=1 Tax=Mycoplasmopsis maculosa TaxID=114885 RepID=A0A449B3R7_9BACT|nr:hypothetical protein [Mycoplasmopsis maculosa]VEU75226.1 Uncharacterised protein [Mycoplasmopsis maculosa]
MKAYKTIDSKMLEDLENRVYVLYDKWKNYFNSTEFIKNVNVIKEGDNKGICVLTLKDVFIHSLRLQKSRKYRNIKNSSAVNKIILKELDKTKFHIKKIEDYATIEQKIPVFEKYFNMLINKNDIPDYVSVGNNSWLKHIFKYSYIWIDNNKVYVLGLIVFDSWFRLYKHIYGKN